jgi:hypothetical protein
MREYKYLLEAIWTNLYILINNYLVAYLVINLLRLSLRIVEGYMMIWFFNGWKIIKIIFIIGQIRENKSY